MAKKKPKWKLGTDADFLTREQVQPLIDKFVTTDETGYYGFFIRRGWYMLLEDLFEKITAIGWDGSLGQVKEKFGSLRVHVGKSNQDVYDILHDYMVHSTITCEICGEQGMSRNLDGVIVTLCDDHLKAAEV